MVGKSGSITDIFIFIIVALVLCITVVIMIYASTTAETELYNNIDVLQSAVGSTGNATEIVQNTFGKVPNAYESLKWITTMLLVGMALSILIHSFLVRIRPVFMIPYILTSLIAVIVSVPISNTYETLLQNPTLASSFNGFFGQTYIMLHLPIWVTVITMFAGMVMFINMVKQGQYGGYE